MGGKFDYDVSFESLYDAYLSNKLRGIERVVVDSCLDKFGDKIKVGSIVVTAVSNEAYLYIVQEIWRMGTSEDARAHCSLIPYFDSSNQRRVIVRGTENIIRVGEEKMVAMKLTGRSTL